MLPTYNSKNHTWHNVCGHRPSLKGRVVWCLEVTKHPTYACTHHHPYLRIIPTYVCAHHHPYLRTYVHTTIPTYVRMYTPPSLPTYVHTTIPTYVCTHHHPYLRTYVHTTIPTYVRMYTLSYALGQGLSFLTISHRYVYTYIRFICLGTRVEFPHYISHT